MRHAAVSHRVVAHGTVVAHGIGLHAGAGRHRRMVHAIIRHRRRSLREGGSSESGGENSRGGKGWKAVKHINKLLRITGAISRHRPPDPFFGLHAHKVTGAEIWCLFIQSSIFIQNIKMASTRSEISNLSPPSPMQSRIQYGTPSCNKGVLSRRIHDCPSSLHRLLTMAPIASKVGLFSSPALDNSKERARVARHHPYLS
jgi:hypothetical protein